MPTSSLESYSRAAASSSESLNSSRSGGVALSTTSSNEIVFTGHLSQKPTQPPTINTGTRSKKVLISSIKPQTSPDAPPRCASPVDSLIKVRQERAAAFAVDPANHSYRSASQHRAPSETSTEFSPLPPTLGKPGSPLPIPNVFQYRIPASDTNASSSSTSTYQPIMQQHQVAAPQYLIAPNPYFPMHPLTFSLAIPHDPKESLQHGRDNYETANTYMKKAEELKSNAYRAYWTDGNQAQSNMMTDAAKSYVSQAQTILRGSADQLRAVEANRYIDPGSREVAIGILRGRIPRLAKRLENLEYDNR